MNTLLNSLSNFVNSTSNDHKFKFDISSDEKLNQLSAVPNKKPKISGETPASTHITKYRLMRRKDEIILQKSRIRDGNLIWIDIPTVTEELNNEMAS